MGFFDCIRSWFRPKLLPRRLVATDEQLMHVPDDLVMAMVVRKTAMTGQSVSIHRPNPHRRDGETAEEAKARLERELDAMAELLGLDREKAA